MSTTSTSAPWTRLIRFIAAEDNQIYYGQPLQSGDIGLLYNARGRITAHVLSSSPLDPLSVLTPTLRTVKRLLSPLSQAEVGTVRGMGAQYVVDVRDRVKPEIAVLFYKPASSLCGPEDDIVIPESARGENNDYEVELSVVIGRDAKNVRVEDALDYVLGYSTSNDVSSRGLCVKGLQWGIGKSYDTWCPVGPVLVSPSLIPDPQSLSIKTTVNGQLKQHSTTANMVLSVAELISRMSQGVTIEAGSIILTGSPPPIGREVDKTPFLKQGDDVRVWVEGCGTLINHVVEEGGVKAQAKL